MEVFAHFQFRAGEKPSSTLFRLFCQGKQAVLILAFFPVMFGEKMRRCSNGLPLHYLSLSSFLFGTLVPFRSLPLALFFSTVPKETKHFLRRQILPFWGPFFSSSSPCSSVTLSFSNRKDKDSIGTKVTRRDLDGSKNGENWKKKQYSGNDPLGGC